MLSIGQIKEPQQVHLRGTTSLTLACNRPVKAPSSELWLTSTIPPPICRVVVQNVQKGFHDSIRPFEGLRLHEVQIVCRCMVFRESAVHTAHKTADRQIDPWGTKLAFVIAVRIERYDFVLLAGM